MPPRGPRTHRRAAGSSRRGQAVPETRAASGRGHAGLGPVLGRLRVSSDTEDMRLHAFISNKHTGSKTQHKKLWTLLNIQPQAQVSFLKRPSGRRPPSEALFTRDRYKKLYSGAITGNLSDELPNTNHRQIHGQPHEKENPTELHGS